MEVNPDDAIQTTKVEFPVLVKSFHDEIKTMVEVLKCFDERTTLVDCEFDFRDSYYSIRYHILGFTEALEWVEMQGDEMRSRLLEITPPERYRELSGIFNDGVQLYQKAQDEKAYLAAYIAKERPDFIVKEEGIVLWEDHIVIEPQKGFEVEFRRQACHLRNDVLLTLKILQCLETQMGLHPSVQSLYRRFILHSCACSIDAFKKCRDRLEGLLECELEALSDACFDGLGEEVESLRREIQIVHDKHREMELNLC